MKQVWVDALVTGGVVVLLTGLGALGGLSRTQEIPDEKGDPEKVETVRKGNNGEQDSRRGYPVMPSSVACADPRDAYKIRLGKRRGARGRALRALMDTTSCYYIPDDTRVMNIRPTRVPGVVEVTGVHSRAKGYMMRSAIDR